MPVRANRMLPGAVVLLLCLGRWMGAGAPTFPELTVGADAGLPPAGFAIETFRTDEGLPQNSINSIIQSTDGYLWMGTYNGLVRFDGVRAKVFDSSSKPPLRDVRVLAVFEDSRGGLWLGHENGTVTLYREGVFHDVDLGERWPRVSVVGIIEDGRGDIWVLNNHGTLVRASDSRMMMLATAAGSTPAGSPSLLADASRRVWMRHRGVVGKVDSTGLTPVDFGDDAGAPYIKELCAAKGGGLWVITPTLLRQWKGGAWLPDWGLCPWEDRSITCALETQDGRLVVGTLDQGLYIIGPSNTVSHLTRDNGLPHEWVRSVCEDHEGNLWVGTSGAGVSVLRKARVVMVNPPDDWRGRTVLSVTAGLKGELWAGTEGAGLYRLRHGQWDRFDAEQGLVNPFIWSVLVNRLGVVHAGTWGEGVYVLQNGRFVLAPGWENLQLPVTSMAEAADAALWVGTGRGLLKQQGTNVTWVYGDRSAFSLEVRTVLDAGNGEVWFGIYGVGLAKVDHGTVKLFTKADGLGSDFILDVTADTDGTLWIGTLDNGLCRFREGTLTPINTDAGLVNNVIGAVADDGLGHLWLSSQQGILRVSKAELNRYADGEADGVSCLVYGKRQGLATMAGSAGFSPSWCRTTDGRLVFPTARGIAVVDPSEVEPNRHAPSVEIEELLVEGRLRTTTNRATLARSGESPAVVEASGGGDWLEMAPGERRLEVHYTALSFVSPEKVLFRYRLEPLEKEWVEAETRRVANYSFVPPGTYTFRVVACNNDRVWNLDGAHLTVHVLPRFWETVWFKATTLLCTVGLVGGVVVVDARRRLRRRLERLESERAVERERTRIAQDIHDDLGASLTRILMLTQEGSVDSESKESIEDNIRQVHLTARELTREMDEIVWAVNPEHDTLESLINYLCRFAQTFLNTAHLRCRFDVPVDLPTWSVRAEVRHHLFLALKEVLNNIVKHAEASKVRLSVQLLPAELQIELRDDGRGLGGAKADAKSRPDEVDRIVSGLGLEGLRRRLKGLGGVFEIIWAAGEGTTFRFRLPVRSISAPRSMRRDG